MKATNFSSAKALKKLFTVSTFITLTVIGSNAYAQTTCYYDWLDNWICNSDGGYQTTTRTDWLGNDVTNDNRGNTMTCYYDWLDNYVCN